MMKSVLGAILTIALLLNLTTGTSAERREFSGCTNSDTLVTTSGVSRGTIIPAGESIGFKVDCEDDTGFGGGSVALFTIAGIVSGAAIGIGVYYFLQKQNVGTGSANFAEQILAGTNEHLRLSPTFDPNSKTTGLKFALKF